MDTDLKSSSRLVRLLVPPFYHRPLIHILYVLAMIGIGIATLSHCTAFAVRQRWAY